MSGHRRMAAWQVGVVFTAFAFNYFIAALLRAVVATLAPEFARELQLGAGELGLLAGAYFLGFACMQLRSDGCSTATVLVRCCWGC